jgi:hypothetical protein
MGRLTHGNNRVGHQTGVYRSWRAMIQRCCNKNAANYARFGGRGITCCVRWRSFPNFLADLGPRPKNKTLGRVFDLMSYAPDLAGWESPRSQSLHKMSRNFFEGRVKGWSYRKLNAVTKFITKTITSLPDTEAVECQLLEHLYRPPEAA